MPQKNERMRKNSFAIYLAAKASMQIGNRYRFELSRKIFKMMQIEEKIFFPTSFHNSSYQAKV